MACLPGQETEPKSHDLSDGKHKGQGLGWLLGDLAPGQPLWDLPLDQSHHLTDTSQVTGLCQTWGLIMEEETRSLPGRQEWAMSLGSMETEQAGCIKGIGISLD